MYNYKARQGKSSHPEKQVNSNSVLMRHLHVVFQKITTNLMSTNNQTSVLTEVNSHPLPLSTETCYEGRESDCVICSEDGDEVRGGRSEAGVRGDGEGEGEGGREEGRTSHDVDGDGAGRQHGEENAL